MRKTKTTPSLLETPPYQGGELKNLLNAPEGFLSCKDCACIGCSHLDCDIRDKCSECRPLVLLFCSEFEPAYGGVAI
jgi:hypothetical protein